MPTASANQGRSTRHAHQNQPYAQTRQSQETFGHGVSLQIHDAGTQTTLIPSRRERTHAIRDHIHITHTVLFHDSCDDGCHIARRIVSRRHTIPVQQQHIILHRHIRNRLPGFGGMARKYDWLRIRVQCHMIPLTRIVLPLHPHKQHRFITHDAQVHWGVHLDDQVDACFVKLPGKQFQIRNRWLCIDALIKSGLRRRRNQQQHHDQKEDRQLPHQRRTPAPHDKAPGSMQPRPTRQSPLVVRVRFGTPDDLEWFAQASCKLGMESEGLVVEPETPRAAYKALLSDPHKGLTFIAEDEDGPVGSLFVTYEWSDWNNGWYWWIQGVYVHPRARRQGMYRTLYEAVHQAAAKRGDVLRIRLYVDVDNQAALATYRATGMKEAHYRIFDAPVGHHDQAAG